MANLKEIRDRIKSVKNTRKITEAMRLVAAAKVRRAQEQVLRSRPFADRLARLLENLQARMRFEDADAPLLEQRDVDTITLVAVTGDRGLCGGYNANIIKRTEQRFAELKGQGYKVDLVLIGRKAISFSPIGSTPSRPPSPVWSRCLRRMKPVRSPTKCSQSFSLTPPIVWRSSTPNSSTW